MTEPRPTVVILAGPNGAAPRLRDLCVSGHAVHLFFLWLPSPDLAVQRVADREATFTEAIAPALSVLVGNS